MDPVETDNLTSKYSSDISEFVRMNLHNHSTFSDGSFTPEFIIKKAIEYRLNYIAITDHYLTSKTRSMSDEVLENYITQMEELKEKYRNRIRVLSGVEIDASRRTDFHRMRYDLLNSMDIVLFEYVNDDVWGGMHLWELFDVFDRIEVPIGLAHSDINVNFRDIDYNALLQVLEDHGIFVELCPSQRNSKFGRPFYRFAVDFFRILSDTDVMVSIGTDAHTRPEEIGDIQDAVQFVEEFDLWTNLISLKI